MTTPSPDQPGVPAVADAFRWGVPPSARYEELLAPIRPVLREIRAASLAAELQRSLPFEILCRLRDTTVLTFRLPVEDGGTGATLVELAGLMAELAWADSNVTQALRGHFAFVDHVLVSSDAAYRRRWIARLARGEIVAPAASELGEQGAPRLRTRLSRTGDEWRLQGSKFYTTGALFADWIAVIAVDPAEEVVQVTVPRTASGVEVVDDWDGMGQRLTASGTTNFVDVPVDHAEVSPQAEFLAYAQAFYQIVHLATLTGIARAAADDVAAQVARRKRTYSHATSANPVEDPQILQLVGQIRSAAFSAGAVLLHAARGLDLPFASYHDTDARTAAVATAELGVWQAQSTLLPLVTEATSSVYDVLGSSAVFRLSGLDRYWRNARTVSSHNPRIYRERIIGDFAVNGGPLPPPYRVGFSANDDKTVSTRPA